MPSAYPVSQATFHRIIEDFMIQVRQYLVAVLRRPFLQLFLVEFILYNICHALLSIAAVVLGTCTRIALVGFVHLIGRHAFFSDFVLNVLIAAFFLPLFFLASFIKILN